MFRGNGYTSSERAQDFALLRASELALQHGFAFFAIVDENNSTTVSSFTTPGYSTTRSSGTGSTSGDIYFNPHGASYSGNSSGVVNSSTTYMPPITHHIYRPRTGLLIRGFQTKPDGFFTFDARFLGQSLKAKYGIKQDRTGISFPALGQDTNTPSQPTTNFDRLEPKHALAAGTDTNGQQTSTPPSSNSISFQEIKSKAEAGSATAQTALGDAYSTGQGVATNLAEAVKWFGKAAEQGNATAQFNLGVCFQKGQGVAQDYTEAVKWFRKAAEQGFAEAQGKLGLMYELGWGVTQDDADAVKWYRKAAEQGEAAAQTKLGLAYIYGKGVPQDDAEAVKWCRKAAEQGNAHAQLLVGSMYDVGQGVPQDYIEAYKWYNLAAAQNQTNAIHHRDRISDSMTPSQIAEGQRLSREFVARKEGVASNRADGQNSAVVGSVPRFTGSGFFVTDDGCLLTCYHVVEDAGRIAVRTTAGTFAATLVKADKANDVALLKVIGKFPALPVASSRGVKLGESVFTIGFPNIELQGFAPKLTKGEISSLAGVQDDPREFQISVAVQPGNSGGPLVNQYGNVVGIVAAQLADMATLQTTGSLPQSVNYAVKSSVLNVLLESLPEISAKLPEPNPIKDRKFEDVEREAESAVALVLVY
jgi:TPR repeat protein